MNDHKISRMGVTDDADIFAFKYRDTMENIYQRVSGNRILKFLYGLHPENITKDFLNSAYKCAIDAKRKMAVSGVEFVGGGILGLTTLSISYEEPEIINKFISAMGEISNYLSSNPEITTKIVDFVPYGIILSPGIFILDGVLGYILNTGEYAAATKKIDELEEKAKFD